MAKVVTVTRRHLRENYFDKGSGYQGSAYNGGGSATPTRHWEVGRIELEAGDSNNVIHYFGTPFPSNPIGINNFKCYRWEQRGSQWVITDVLFSSPWKPFALPYGFQIIIDATEDVEGVIIEFTFTG